MHVSTYASRERRYLVSKVNKLRYISMERNLKNVTLQKLQMDTYSMILYESFKNETTISIVDSDR